MKERRTFPKGVPIEMDEQDEHGVMLEILKILYNDKKIPKSYLPSHLNLPLTYILSDYFEYDEENDIYKERE